MIANIARNMQELGKTSFFSCKIPCGKTCMIFFPSSLRLIERFQNFFVFYPSNLKFWFTHFSLAHLFDADSTT